MAETMTIPKFRVEFEKVCSACGAECPYLTIQEFEINFGFPETRKRRKCKNESICRNAVLSEYKRLKNRFVKEFAAGTDDNVEDSQ